jgi:hypothetical protein
MAVEAESSKSPPRPSIAFRVGIVGHRPNRLPEDAQTLEALKQLMSGLLALIQAEVSAFAQRDGATSAPAYAAASTPILRAISPLAEGADRMFAEAAIDLGFELLCPMPFHQQEFEKDFLPPNALEDGSLDRFRGLLTQAQHTRGLVTFELDGRRSSAGAAYAMAGRVVLNQSDFLIVVWDRGGAAGGGGTVQTLREAIYFNVPVIWIDPFRPNEWRILQTEEDIASIEIDGLKPPQTPPSSTDARLPDIARIKAIVEAELSLPRPSANRLQVTKLSAVDYFSERRPRWNLWFWWKIFRDLAGGSGLRMPKITVPDFECTIREDWPLREHASPMAPAPSPIEDWLNRRLRLHYAWADKLADWYADHYRSAYLAIYVLSALAVLTAVTLHASVCGAVLEFILVGIIVVLFFWGSRGHWHERWMEYRLLAELIRHLRILIPLGGGRPLPRAGALTIYESLAQTWMYWDMRAVARATGIPPAKITSRYLLDYIRYIAKIVGTHESGQLYFHRLTKKRSESITLLLESIAYDLFILSFCFVVVHLLAHLAGWAFASKVFVENCILALFAAPAVLAATFWIFFRTHITFLVLAIVLALGAVLSRQYGSESLLDFFLVLGALPAFGAAVASIANQGEFARLARRSVAMASVFERFADRIKELEKRLIADTGSTETQLADAIALAAEITQVMVDEVSDWRFVVAEQPMRVS